MSTIAAARPASASFRALGCECRVVVTDPVQLGRARSRLEAMLADVDRAASRFRADSEVRRLAATDGAPTTVSPLLADLIRAALDAAERTDGTVDPTLGRALEDCGYDADLAALPPGRPGAVVRIRPRARWRDIRLEGTVLHTPPGLLLDLGATAKAATADRAADVLGAELGCGVLVGLGGDLAVGGQPPPGGWTVRVQDRPQPLDERPSGLTQTVAITGGGLATSSTAARRWAYGAAEMHHLLDPATGLPARTPWRTVSATAPTCLEANVTTTATVVLGDDGLAHARRSGLAMRLVPDERGGSPAIRPGQRVVRLGGWPA